jgi:hypothetical protein
MPNAAEANPQDIVAPIQPLDYDEDELAEVRRWASDEAGMEAAQENPTGYAAIMLHADMHKQRLQANAPPPEIKRSLTIPLDKMPQEAQAQELEKAGDHLTPQDFALKHAADKDLKATAPPKPPTNGNGKSKESK